MNLGILDPILQDPDVVEILINGHEHVYIDKRGELVKLESGFESEDELLRIIGEIATPLGHQLNESTPIIDVRLPDGSRVHIVGRPIAVLGPSVTIRKFRIKPFKMPKLLEFNFLSPEMAQFLRVCVEQNVSIFIVGGVGSGKTMLMNALCDWIPAEERLITIERAPELTLTAPHRVALEYRPPNVEGRGEITMRQLVQSALKMRADRLIVDAMEGSEALDLIQGINNGHKGALTTFSASSPRDALAKLEIMMMQGNPSLPLLGAREGMAAAVDVIVCLDRLKDKKRRMVSVTEVTGMTNGMVEMQEIFRFVPQDTSGDIITGTFSGTGQLPRFLARLKQGSLPLDIFAPRA